MPNLDTFSFFLIILGGFGFVWSYRSFSRSKQTISEFEYLAFSAFWGTLIFVLFTWILREKPDLLEAASNIPYVATPSIFLLGASLGFAVFQLISLIKLLLGSLWEHVGCKIPQGAKEFVRELLNLDK